MYSVFKFTCAVVENVDVVCRYGIKGTVVDSLTFVDITAAALAVTDSLHKNSILQELNVFLTLKAGLADFWYEGTIL